MPFTSSQIHFCVTCFIHRKIILTYQNKNDMKRLIITNGDYNIYQVDKNYLYAIAKFVVLENYKHHTNDVCSKNTEEDILKVYKEELQFSSVAYLFIAENHRGKLIGCIRVMKWDKITRLPIHKIFNINLQKCIPCSEAKSFWHIGRFAIDSLNSRSSILLFKQLMICAVHQIICDTHGCMIAETDSKLLRILQLLGIQTHTLGPGIIYLGSETIPLYATKFGLSKFYNSHRHLLCNLNISHNVQLETA